jgi:hypothetical protein
MNAQLRNLLASVGIAEPAETVLINNMGPIPPVASERDGSGSLRGFNLLLLDDRGQPTHLCKCRPEASASARREAHVLAALRRDPALAAVLLPTWNASSDGMQLVVYRFERERDLAQRAGRYGRERWFRAARQILALANVVSSRAATVLPELGAGRPITLAEAMRRPLADLAAAGVNPLDLADLARVLAEGGTVRAHLQHGDLWAANVLPHGDGWWLLDFEHYGAISVPLYDVCHFLRTGHELRAGRRAAGTWFDSQCGDDDEAARCRAVIREQVTAQQLDDREAAGAIVYYFTEFTARAHRYAPATTRQRSLAELASLAAAIRRGESVGRICFGGA